MVEQRSAHETVQAFTHWTGSISNACHVIMAALYYRGTYLTSRCLGAGLPRADNAHKPGHNNSILVVMVPKCNTITC